MCVWRSVAAPWGETGGLTQQLFPHNTQTSMLGSRKGDSFNTKGYEAASSSPSTPFSSCATQVTVSVTSWVMARHDTYSCGLPVDCRCMMAWPGKWARATGVCVHVCLGRGWGVFISYNGAHPHHQWTEGSCWCRTIRGRLAACRPHKCKTNQSALTTQTVCNSGLSLAVHIFKFTNYQ